MSGFICYSSHLRAVNLGFSAVRKIQAEWWCGWWVLQTVTQWRHRLEGLLLGDVLARTSLHKTMSRWDVISVRPFLITVIRTQARWEEQFFKNVVSVSIDSYTCMTSHKMYYSEYNLKVWVEQLVKGLCVLSYGSTNNLSCWLEMKCFLSDWI